MSVSTAFVLMVVKFAAALLTNSMAILASAADSLMDFLMSSINFFALKESDKPADKDDVQEESMSLAAIPPKKLTIKEKLAALRAKKVKPAVKTATKTAGIVGQPEGNTGTATGMNGEKITYNRKQLEFIKFKIFIESFLLKATV